MKAGVLGETLLKSSPKVIDESGKFDEVFDFARLRSTWFPQERKLVLLYAQNSYSYLKVFFKYLVSDHVCMVFPDVIPLESRQEIERTYKPNVIVDSPRADLGKPESVFLETGTYRYSDVEHDLHPKLKLLLSTSGSTGSPKLVKVSHENLVAHIGQMQAIHHHGPEDVALLYGHTAYGSPLSFLNMQLAGSSVVVPCKGAYNSPEFWQLMRQYKVNSFVTLPIRYEAILANDLRDLDGMKMRYMTIGAGKARIEMLKRLAEYCKANGSLFFHAYGLTEAFARIACLESEHSLTKIGSIGKPTKGGKFTLAEDGELIYSGPTIFGGYVHSAADIPGFNQAEKIFTGDLARVDEDGFYYIVGRKKRLYKFSGNRIVLDEFESRLAETLGVPVYLAGVDDGFLVVVVTSPTLERSRIESALSSHMSPLLFRATRIRRMEKLPEVGIAKVDYNKILELESKNQLQEA